MMCKQKSLPCIHYFLSCTHIHMYRKSTQSSRLEGWSGAAPSLPVQFYVSALIQIHTAWELTPPPEVCVCMSVSVCVCLCAGINVQSTTCLLAQKAKLQPLPEGALGCLCACARVHKRVCLRAHILHASVYLQVCDPFCFPHEAIPH